MLVHLIPFRLRLYLGRTRKMRIVKFSLLRSSWLVFNCISLSHHVSPTTTKKHESSLPFTWCWWVKHPLLAITRMRTRFYGTSRFSKSYLISVETLALPFRVCLIIFYCNFNFLEAVQLRYIIVWVSNNGPRDLGKIAILVIPKT